MPALRLVPLHQPDPIDFLPFDPASRPPEFSLICHWLGLRGHVPYGHSVDRALSLDLSVSKLYLFWHSIPIAKLNPRERTLTIDNKRAPKRLRKLLCEAARASNFQPKFIYQ